MPLEAWREQALRELKGAPLERLIARAEGLQIEPLYPAEPTALPGRAAIHAALHPAPGSALFFVARGDGSHEFSASLEEHNRAVRKFQLQRRGTPYRSRPQD